MTSAILAAWRATDFTVGLTNVSPQVMAPVLGQYILCGQYPGAVPAGATVGLTCTDTKMPYRYLTVQVSGADCLSICEIEVYPRGKIPQT